jgi:hypothetical protein
LKKMSITGQKAHEWNNQKDIKEWTKDKKDLREGVREERDGFFQLWEGSHWVGPQHKHDIQLHVLLVLQHSRSEDPIQQD